MTDNKRPQRISERRAGDRRKGAGGYSGPDRRKASVRSGRDRRADQAAAREKKS